MVEPKNATEIPEKTNVTEETIENIVLPEKVRSAHFHFKWFVDTKWCPPMTYNVQGAAEKEHSSSLAIAFLLFTLILSIFMIHAMLQVFSTAQLSWQNGIKPRSFFPFFYHPTLIFWSQIKFHYLPESLAIVFLGAVLGLLMTALPEAETKRVRLIITFLISLCGECPNKHRFSYSLLSLHF